MGWQIDLFRIRPGQDPCKVRDVQYDWEQHDGYVVVDSASAETDAWIKHAMELLESVSPGFKLVEEDGELSLRFDDHGHILHVRIWQPDGPLIVNLYPDCADLRVNTLGAEGVRRRVVRPPVGRVPDPRRRGRLRRVPRG